MNAPSQSHLVSVLRWTCLNSPLSRSIALGTVFFILIQRVMNTYLGAIVCLLATRSTDHT